MIEVGRLCLKIAGRESGRYCVVVKEMDENFVMVTGPRELTSVKRRRCNINHLEPVMETLNIKSDAPDSEILKAYQQANLITKLGLGPRKAGKPEKKAEEKAEKPGEKKEKPMKEKPPERKIEKRKPKKEPKKSKPGKPVRKPATKKAAKKPASKKAKK